MIDYFPAALAAIARVSKYGNDKHNPGQPMHHARGKSMDHADTIGRHLIDRGGIEPDTGLRHSGFLAWRALALLQEELEREEGAPLARAAKVEEPSPEMKPKTIDPKHPMADWVREVTKPQAPESSLDIARRQYGFPGEAIPMSQEPRRPAVPIAIQGCVL